jgi:hypothetical protein
MTVLRSRIYLLSMHTVLCFQARQPQCLNRHGNLQKSGGEWSLRHHDGPPAQQQDV